MTSVWGLTGGIACGKSTVAHLLEAKGWQVVDSDAIAHQLMQPGGTNYQKLVDTFGSSILNEDQTVNRRYLGQLVFGQPALRHQLNELTHPAIRHAWRSKVADFSSHSPQTPIAVMIPLLFEVGLQTEFFSVMCIGCSPRTQVKRLQSRSLSEEEAKIRVASQWPIEKKMQSSHYTIWTEGSLTVVELQVQRLVRLISAEVI
jgi:dephospho-CoA kinase